MKHSIKHLLKKVKTLHVLIEKLRKKNKQHSMLKARKNYIKILSELHKNSFKKKINVYFVITQKQLWNSTDLFIALKQDARFSPAAIIFPNFENKINSIRATFEENKSFFTSLNIKTIDGINTEDILLDPQDVIDKNSIIFFDQPWPQLGRTWKFLSVSNLALICYIPYGFKIANNYSGHFTQDLHNIAWKLFIETQWHYSMFSKLNMAEGKNTVITGYAKLDQYLAPPKITTHPTSLQLIKKIANRKIIIWAPHWSMHDGLLNYSTFDLYFDRFRQMVRDRNELFFIFKPHQRLRHFAEEIGLMSKKEIDEYYQFFESSENSVFYNEPDYIDFFKTSAAMITDSGSFLAEYLPSEKPLLLLKSKDSVGYNELGAKLVDNYYNAQKWSDVEQFIDNVVLMENDPMSKQRRLFLSEIWDPHSGSSSQKIVNHISESIHQGTLE